MEKVYIGVGSNVGREQNIRTGISELTRRFGALTLSPVYESQAVGFSGDNFYNLVAGFDTTLTPEQLLEELHAIEALCHRVRVGTRYGSRTLDLDLLMYGGLVQREGRLRVPRDEITRFAFVLKPLTDIAADVVHPVLQVRIAELWDSFQDPEQTLWVVGFNPL
ncbi:MAG: 2-amino-4-hydroxy-6-hydroxymethyldihydropteridine diphosphokinase [Gammaproteobacteria bacterium]|nr:MAG: 2-amino-4-hydroxy-6-hydroxymethyldihydropteridine diphosphokinase [Gammaproteobacteria bacterium]